MKLEIHHYYWLHKLTQFFHASSVRAKITWLPAVRGLSLLTSHSFFREHTYFEMKSPWAHVRMLRTQINLSW